MPDWKNMDTWDKIKEVLTVVALMCGVILGLVEAYNEALFPILTAIAAKTL